MDRAKFILASASPRRRELLEKAGFSFEIAAANVVEDENPNGVPEAAVAHNARIKALFVAEKNPSALVLGADTTVALNGKIFNKPADFSEAREMLKTLSGATHTVFTGVCLARILDGILVEKIFKSRVTFINLSVFTISLYFKIVNPLVKAGAYGIQEGRDLIVENFEPPLSNIMGLPVEKIAEDLRRFLA